MTLFADFLHVKIFNFEVLLLYENNYRNNINFESFFCSYNMILLNFK